ncbi:MAG: hypothetical protein N3B16_10950 [Candidatus Aminicenantes bacterium]|nr:hypothetical protein [Candidatus Aminicenantes bacterium]
MKEERSIRLTPGFWTMMAFFILALWLVSPFIKIDPSDYDQAQKNLYRLFFGLFILIIELGILTFETFSPQGFARRVSNFRAVAVFLFGLLLLAFIIFIVAQSAVIYLRSGLSQIESPY